MESMKKISLRNRGVFVAVAVVAVADGAFVVVRPSAPPQKDFVQLQQVEAIVRTVKRTKLERKLFCSKICVSFAGNLKSGDKIISAKMMIQPFVMIQLVVLLLLHKTVRRHTP